MSNVSGLLGTAGGFKGTGVNGPIQAFDPSQISQTTGNTQSSIQQMASLLAAIQAQNGLQNQSQVFKQLQDIVAGTGANPATAVLNQATGKNVAATTAAMAGQRGSSQNTGMVARTAAEQGAATQQDAAGQAATLQAQQSLNALNQAGGIAGQQVQNQVGETNSINSADQNLLNAMTGATGQLNNVNSGLINSTSTQQANIGTGVMQGAGKAAMMADGGKIGPSSNVGRYMSGKPMAMPTPMAAGGKVPVMLSKGEQVIPPEELPAVASGKKDPFKAGQRVPGKPKYPGNDYRNDVVPADAKKGAVVIPNKIMETGDHWAAMKFVRAHMAAGGKVGIKAGLSSKKKAK